VLDRFLLIFEIVNQLYSWPFNQAEFFFFFFGASLDATGGNKAIMFLPLVVVIKERASSSCLVGKITRLTRPF